MTEFKARIVTEFDCRECGAPMQWVGIDSDGYLLQCTKCDHGIIADVSFTFKVEIIPAE